ncbi:MAG TPA: DEAD/DEAH box helicase [Cytophagaceae bacterium]
MEHLKLNKQIASALSDEGFREPKEIQSSTFSRIMGGQDIIAIGPESCGKSTSIVIGVLAKLNYAQDAPPRALILVPSKEHAQALEQQFKTIGKNTDLRLVMLLPGAGIEGQKEALATGTDIVIGTPDRVFNLYLKSGINISKLKIFVMDDAHLIIQQGFQSLVHQLSESLPKCQHLIFSEVLHNKLERLISPFMNNPALVEVTEMQETAKETIGLSLYPIPNYKSKLNLINLLLSDYEAYPKVLVITNQPITAKSVHKSLNKRLPGETALLNLNEVDAITISSINDFINAEGLRILIASNDSLKDADISTAPYILHFDVPEDVPTFVNRLTIKEGENTDDTRQSITFATDIELTLIKKSEQLLGKSFIKEDLPFGLIIEGDRKSHKNDPGKNNKGAEENPNPAFHPKKESNAKTYNYKYKDRLKLFGKKNRKGKKG